MCLSKHQGGIAAGRCVRGHLALPQTDSYLGVTEPLTLADTGSVGAHCSEPWSCSTYSVVFSFQTTGACGSLRWLFVTFCVEVATQGSCSFLKWVFMTLLCSLQSPQSVVDVRPFSDLYCGKAGSQLTPIQPFEFYWAEGNFNGIKPSAPLSGDFTA